MPDDPLRGPEARIVGPQPVDRFLIGRDDAKGALIGDARNLVLAVHVDGEGIVVELDIVATVEKEILNSEIIINKYQMKWTVN